MMINSTLIETPNLVQVNLCVTKARKLLEEKATDSIPEIIGYFSRYNSESTALMELYKETNLDRYKTLAVYKMNVAKELIKCLEGLNQIRIDKEKAGSFENDSFQEEVTNISKQFYRN